MAASAILQGDNPGSDVPPIVSEFFMALEFGWKLNYIRTLPWREVDILTTLISLMYKIISQGKDYFAKAIADGMK